MRRFKHKFRNNNSKSKLCCFSYVDYYILASTLSATLADELTPLDLDILSAFFAVLSDELALASAVLSCDSNDDSDEDDSSGEPDPEELGIVIRGNHRQNKKIKTKKRKVRVKR